MHTVGCFLYVTYGIIYVMSGSFIFICDFDKPRQLGTRTKRISLYILLIRGTLALSTPSPALFQHLLNSLYIYIYMYIAIRTVQHEKRVGELRRD